MFLGFLCILLAVFGCASGGASRSDYDGGSDVVATATELMDGIPVHIENHRTQDAVPPHFILVGSGRYDLGQIDGFGGRLDRMIDRSWLRGGDCITVVAHYVGGGDLVFDEVCWKSGERITAALDDIFTPGAAWSHR